MYTEGTRLTPHGITPHETIPIWIGVLFSNWTSGPPESPYKKQKKLYKQFKYLIFQFFFIITKHTHIHLKIEVINYYFVYKDILQLL